MNLIPWDWFKDEDQSRDKKRQLWYLRERDPFFSKFYSDMERAVDDIFNSYIPLSRRGKSSGTEFISPRINISESDNQYKITAEMPGIKEDDIDLSINKGMLTIKAEKKEEKEDKNENYHRVERLYGTFQRSITLPEDAKEDSINAKFKNGVLNIIMEKDAKAKAETKKIKVKTE